MNRIFLPLNKIEQKDINKVERHHQSYQKELIFFGCCFMLFLLITVPIVQYYKIHLKGKPGDSLSKKKMNYCSNKFNKKLNLKMIHKRESSIKIHEKQILALFNLYLL